MDFAAIIVAAGSGTRAGGGLPKQFRPLAGGASSLARSVGAFRAFPACTHIVVVAAAEHEGLARAQAGDGVTVVPGGATRQASVRAGLEALQGVGPSHVLIHDAARPLVSAELIARVAGAVDAEHGAVPAVPVTDTLLKGTGVVEGTVDRDGLARAQTPQGFPFAPLLAAHRAAVDGATDDAGLAAAAGLTVRLVEGDPMNIKLTEAGDFTVAAAYLGADMDIRTGLGFDVHAFEDGDHVILCGVQVPHDRTLKGHSDADVAMHAVTDAIYGALAAGDIGQHFPPSDPAFKGMQSRVFLEHACGMARDEGFRITHIDCTMVCEMPKIGPHARAMRQSLADICGLDAGRISVKATTSEGLGFTGRGEGIAAFGTATLVRP